MRATKRIVRCWPVLACMCLVSPLLQADDRLSEEQVAFFEKRIRPVLADHCYECHSERAEKLKGGLRLDLRETLRRGGDSGPAIVPGQTDKSLLIAAVRYESLEMPPQGRLPERVIADLVRWVEMGAPDPRVGKSTHRPEPTDVDGWSHWAFQPVKAKKRPDVRDSSWPLSELDAFVLSRIERAGLIPAEDADRYTWLRRVSFDLTGMPPTIDEIRRFQEDTSPLAWTAVVDRLIGSRAFGERWARHWLDLVGYADQIGTSNDVFAEHAWRYRDYVINSLNEDRPFDRFIREQIAGDLLHFDSVSEQVAGITATGFLVLGDLDIVEADKARLHVDIIDQQVVKIGQTFLGMTLGCARCHDHKFDPIPQRDYYAIAGFFHSTDTVHKTRRGVWSDVNLTELPETESQQAAREERARQHAARIAAWKDERTQASSRKAELDELTGNRGAADTEVSPDRIAKERDQLADRIEQLNQQIEHAEFFAPRVPRACAVRDVELPADMRLTIRGNPRALADAVPRGVLQVARTALRDIPEMESGRRQLADWIASPDNPLTARVAVNRVWQKLFGNGLVRSVDYFGLRGEKPSHPELLDHLASRFTQTGWSRKRLVRSLVLSRTYRMSSAFDERAHAIDPENHLLWRMNCRRLDAEAIRDAMLAVSGQLRHSAGGPALPLEFPENVDNINPKNVNPPSFSLTRWRPEQAFQRTVYLPVIRSGPQPGPAELRNVFDFALPARFAGQRSVTTVPTQALFLMNSPVVKNHARKLAAWLVQETAGTTARLDLLWLCALNRPVTQAEKRDAAAFLGTDGNGNWVELCHAILASSEFLMRL